MIRAVISDLGRVLLWFDNDVFLRRLAERAGRPFEEVKAAVHGDLRLIRRFDGGALTPTGFYEHVITLVGADMNYDEFFGMYNDIFSLNRPVAQLLSRVRQAGYRALLLSNTDPERFGFVIRRFPELQIFDGYVLSYELGLLKPDPAIYIATARLAGCPPSECVFIDDIEENVRGAEAVGMTGVHYRPQADLEAELRELGLRF